LAEVETRVEKWAAGATKPSEVDVKGRIIEHLWWLKKQGYRDSTIKTRTRFLKTLTKKGANLLDPESVKETIAKMEWCESSKVQLVAAYATFALMMKITWDPPNYKQTQSLPFIPTETEIDQLIAGCGKKTATLLQTIKETAVRVGEAWRLKWTDIDMKRNTIRVNLPEKNSKSGVYRVSGKLIAMLDALPKTSEKVFGGTFLNSTKGNFYSQRKTIARKLRNPRIRQITFHTLRHWKATMLYHQTKDILYVMNFLRHRNINNTLIYIQLDSAIFGSGYNDEFTVKVAKTLKEACELVETGFEYVTEIDGARIFRKRK
jgi:integrase